MKKQEVLYILDDNIKTSYIKKCIKETLVEPTLFSIDIEWLTCKTYNEELHQDYLVMLNEKIHKLKKFADFVEGLGEVSINNLSSVYDLGVYDDYIIRCISGWEWETNSKDEEIDNIFVQQLIDEALEKEYE